MWTINNARTTYSIPHWSEGYFDINDTGHLVARPDRNPGHPGIDLHGLTREVAASDLTLPILVRFKDILRDRVDTLKRAFSDAIDEHGYQGGYSVVYPIKVNQQRCVVESLVQRGVGLEAGSKPELMAVLALADQDAGPVICNGYKDSEYIRLALIGRRLGMQIYIVIEKLSELKLVIRESQALGIEPLLGMRVRLASIGSGKWQNTGGEKAKFGLTASQMLQAVESLAGAGMVDTLHMLHFHMGSQIANIRDIQNGIREAGRIYAELRAIGVPIDTLDVGGGLGVDYEGTRSRSFCSMNYSVAEYAGNIIHTLWQSCNELDLPHPHIISESGRALTAHHAVLITHVIDEERMLPVQELKAPEPDDAPIVHDLWRAYDSLKKGAAGGRSLLEIYHETVHWLAEAQGMFMHGVLDLQQRARVEQLHITICDRLKRLLQPGVRAHREVLDEINNKLADKYFCNFSLFQSLPDVWGIEQIFPVVPLQRLDEEPQRRIVIEDITCDSDGRIDSFVDSEGIEPTLPVHGLREGEPYFLGMFLVGAYQEILGDMHNLFGDTDSVNVELLGDGSYRLISPKRGDTVDNVLRYVNFEPEDLKRAYREKISQAGLDELERQHYLETLCQGIDGYTYLEE